MSLPEYELIRSDRRTLALEVRGNRLLVRAPMRTSRREIDAFVASHEAWIGKHLARTSALPAAEPLTDEELRALADEAARVLPERAAYYASLLGVRYGRITIRCQRTKWGSCSSRGNLNFNCLLMLAPPAVADSVVVHELCHLREMNHSDRFYREIARVMPDYEERQRWLRENGAALMARAERTNS